jgi:5-deoxy-D-glucuronate isomerase
MALSVDSTTLKPLQMTSIFKKDTPIIYCSVGVGNVSEEIAVSAELVLVRSVSGETTVKKRATSIMTDGPRNLSFSWIRPGDVWLAGEYEVVITAEGKEAVTVPFKIE